MSAIKIKQVSITSAPVECIVNAANSQLQMGGGVCGAIFSAAGATKLQQACNKYKGCPTGEAVITPAFDLKAKYIIHAVGPKWVDGQHGEPDKLSSCYRAALHLAMRHDCHSMAFPLISAGIYGYPKDEAWKIAIDTVSAFQKEHSDYKLNVLFCVIDESTFKLGMFYLKHEQQKQFTFFWQKDKLSGVFSQWFYAPFVIEGIQYETAEQYMMAKKALLFNDYEHYVLIMNETDPQRCKALGKDVRNFDAARWDRCKEEIVYNGNYAKFDQNFKARKYYLFNTGNTILAEASPQDTVWGIGLDASDPDATDPSKWKGQNLLGKILMRVREDLKKKYPHECGMK